jgi:valyl-tRNA synthetase
MGLFDKKKKEEPKILYTDYINWDKDLGFLTLLMTRKKNITKNYFINIYSTQLKDTDFVRDEDLEPIIIKSVNELMKEIAESYKAFLITKYFGSEKELIKFLTEDFYVELTNAAIVQNSDKIKANATRKRVTDIGRINNRTTEEVEEE